ncbi:lipocalin family protein [Piscinibacter terrae]|uniref:Outer membrane lipoprotein Blc n=1 Tax=Piscinibacter terrae TaxID=2496871 RepID=A0A3N7HR99_9BURK|nr:lipocalin family protein [Albitalea terrae]RQP24777.1 lipocalin [Albitalea terrae]
MPTGSIFTAGVSGIAAKLAGIATAVAAIVMSVATASPPVHSVEHLDLMRFGGVWFEVARLPNKMQSRCRHDATATYRLQVDGGLEVIHRCRDADDRVAVSVGHAALSGNDPARLSLSYVPPWLSWWPGTHADHWVVMIDEGYRHAVVSDPSRGSLWILSRLPGIDAATYDDIIARLRAQRFPVERLVLTPQHVQQQVVSPSVAPPRLTV